MKKGDRVQVMNTTLGGTPFIEGMARVVKVLGEPEDGRQQALVHFYDDPPGWVVFRWIELEKEKGKV